MIRRTVEISREPCHLCVRDGQLLILRRTEVPRPLPAHPPNLAAAIPLEDLGVLVVDERETTYTHSALAGLVENACALVVCGRDHAPAGLFLPLSSNTKILARLDLQLRAPKPITKRLWANIVSAKIRAQAANLGHAPRTASRLLTLARTVRSGDPDNAEAQAARLYWPALFDSVPSVPSPFRRRPGDHDALPPNNLLDYGYAILRASLARSLVSAGLLPALGIKHHHRSNAFCLADDLVEPLRPLVDQQVRALALQGRLSLDQPTKADLLRLLTASVTVADELGPLHVACTRYVASVVRVLAKEAREPAFPLWSSSIKPYQAPSAHETDPCT